LPIFIGSCSSYAYSDLISKLRETQPDILIMDVNLPLEKGLKACAEIKDKFPGIKILVFSGFDDLCLIHELFRIGINCYLEKTEGFDALLNAIDDIQKTGYHIRYSLSDMMNADPASGKILKKPSFSKRELTIIELTRQEYTTKEIAEKLGVHVKTIEFHKTKLIDKTNSKRIVGVVNYMVANNHIPRRPMSGF
jgi:DNA-binding NarL/FixJ family response regulator